MRVRQIVSVAADRARMQAAASGSSANTALRRSHFPAAEPFWETAPVSRLSN